MKHNRDFEAYLDDFTKITIYLAKYSYKGNSRFFYLEDDHGHMEELQIEYCDQSDQTYNRYVCKSKKQIEIGRNYFVWHEYARHCILKIGYVVKQAMFDQLFAYDGDDLGAEYTKEKTTFKLWAPTASQVRLNLNGQLHDMVRGLCGVYEAVIERDIEKQPYYYEVLNDGVWQNCLDPYGKSSLSNSSCSVVVDVKSLQSEKKVLPPIENYTDAIIYELHVRDFTSKAVDSIAHANQFLGVVEENEQTVQKKIGFSYLKELGVSHVQLMPVCDFGSVDENHPKLFYNWGYDPMQFMTLEGGYSSNPNDPYARINEFKEMVEKFHEAGLRVIMDVVMNHVFEREEMCLSKIVPNYFFQMNEQGFYSNSSWCGNDFDSNTAMGRKYIVDSCKAWMEIYHVDGFRFDLMGILDIETMNEVERVCRELDPDVMIYGEGWNMPSYLTEDCRATILNDDKMPKIAHFSDRFRDVVKGKTATEEAYQRGFCSGDVDFMSLMKDVMSASVCHRYAPRYFMEPSHVINYVECHDNQTCFDKLSICCKEESEEMRIMRHKLCIASVLFAQGIPFLHAGQEFARTKNGHPNTYNCNDDINGLDWNRKDEYASLVDYTKQCIQLRKEHACLRYAKQEQVLLHTAFSDIEGGCLVYQAWDEQEKLTILMNPSEKEYDYTIEQQNELIFYNQQVGSEPICGHLSVQPLSVIVIKERKTE